MPVDPVNNIYPTDTSLSSSHSLQAFVELVYVQAANNLLYGTLQSLQSALGITAHTLDVLTQIQNIKNLVGVRNVGTIDFDYTAAHNDGNDYVKDYQSAASAFFNQGIFAGLPAGMIPADVVAQLTDIRNEISTVIIPALSASTPRLSSGAEDPNSLLAAMRKVRADLGPALVDTAHLDLWLGDGYGTSSPSTGAIQTRITAAITAAEALNTKQTSSVRNYLNLFEEYYKSASAILQQITEIIKTMAQNFSRG